MGVPRQPDGRPIICAYCNGTGRSDDANECGFCDGGEPLDTQEDWNRTWGRVLGKGPSEAMLQAVAEAAESDDH